MKFPIILLILSASIAAALFKVRQIKNHTSAVRQSILMIDNVEIMLEYRNLSIQEIFHSLSISPNFTLLKFINEINKQIGMGREYETAFNSVLNDKFFTSNYDSEDRDYMQGFLSMLGKSDIAGQIANCKMYKEFFKTKLSVLENDENDRCKSLTALIIGVGVMASIIFI